MIVEVEHPIAGHLKMPGVPVKMSLTHGSVDKPAPMLGQHTAELLKEILGWDEGKIIADGPNETVIKFLTSKLR